MIALIVAIAENGAIGKNNTLIWHLSDDLKRFKKLTTGHTIIMGRKTFESLPNGALPNRNNVVLTHTKNLNFPECKMYNSVAEIVTDFKEGEEENFVIGGGHLYRALLPFAEKIYLTRVHHSFEADVYFPEMDFKQWKIESEEKHPSSEKNEFAFSFINLVRIK